MGNKIEEDIASMGAMESSMHGENHGISSRRPLSTPCESITYNPLIQNPRYFHTGASLHPVQNYEQILNKSEGA